MCGLFLQPWNCIYSVQRHIAFIQCFCKGFQNWENSDLRFRPDCRGKGKAESDYSELFSFSEKKAGEKLPAICPQEGSLDMFTKKINGINQERVSCLCISPLNHMPLKLKSSMSSLPEEGRELIMSPFPFPEGPNLKRRSLLIFRFEVFWLFYCGQISY